MKPQIPKEDMYALGEAAFIVLGSVREVCKNIEGKIDAQFLLNMIESQFEIEHKALSAKKNKKKKDYIG